MNNRNIKYSFVIPLVDEEKNLESLYDKLKTVFKKEDGDYEIIFVDDGSVDNSPTILKNIQSNDERVKVLILKRNFGQAAAIAAGFDFARGDILITMDADLQNSPQDVLKLVTLLDQGYDVVCGWRKNRKDNLILRKIPSYFANKLISAVIGVRLHDYGCTLKAYRREIVKDIRLYGEMHRFLPALAVWVGAKIVETEVEHYPRIHGKSKYGINRVFKILIDLITIKFLMNFETRPNYVFGGMGFISFFLGFLSLVVVAYRLFVLQHKEATPLVFMMVVFFVAGIQLVLMGLLAEVLVRTHFESQNKSVYYIKEKLNI